MNISPQVQQFYDFFDDMIERLLFDIPPGWRLAVGPGEATIAIDEGIFPTQKVEWVAYPIDPEDPNPMLLSGFSTFGPLTDAQREKAVRKFGGGEAVPDN